MSRQNDESFSKFHGCGIITRDLTELYVNSLNTSVYKTSLSIIRNSGIEDIIPINIYKEDIPDFEIKEGMCVEIDGIIDTYNYLKDEKRHLNLHVTVTNISVIDNDDMDNIPYCNECEIEGYLCKPPVYRVTMKGRDICDVIVAVNDDIYGSSYIPVILWRFDALEFSNVPVSTKIHLTGKFQSRKYYKTINGEKESRMAYEISANYVNNCDK